MWRRWIVGVLVAAVLLAIGVGIGAHVGHDGWRHGTEVVQVANPQGGAPSTVVVTHDGAPGFFFAPFGLLLLVGAGLLLFTRRRVGWCGPRWGGPGWQGPQGGPPSSTLVTPPEGEGQGEPSGTPPAS
ncbi:MAG: hypothetical protein U0Y82_01250 [Thermoleophilia bacterium]